MKKLICAILCVSLLLLAGCGGEKNSPNTAEPQNSTSIESPTESLPTQSQDVASPPETAEPQDTPESASTPNADENPTNTVNEDNSQTDETIEKNDTIVSVLENGFAFDTIDKSTVCFNSKTNSYAVLVLSTGNANTFDDIHSKGQWDEYRDSFSELCNSVTSIAKASDETSKYRIIFTSSEKTPLFIFDQDSLAFDIYNSALNEKILAVLEAIAYYAGFDYVSTSFDATENMYTVDVIKAGFSKGSISEAEDISELMQQSAQAFYNIASSLDETMKLTFQLLDENDLSVLLTSTIEGVESISEQNNTETSTNSPTPEKSNEKTTTNPSTNKSSENENDLASSGGTVYVTKTGKKYHYDSNCNGGTYIQSTLSAAEAKGLTPCKKCAGG